MKPKMSTCFPLLTWHPTTPLNSSQPRTRSPAPSLGAPQFASLSGSHLSTWLCRLLVMALSQTGMSSPGSPPAASRASMKEDASIISTDPPASPAIRALSSSLASSPPTPSAEAPPPVSREGGGEGANCYKARLLSLALVASEITVCACLEMSTMDTREKAMLTYNVQSAPPVAARFFILMPIQQYMTMPGRSPRAVASV
mmetsp:Transcript_22593/g.49492  ORF Transcript_22593/g.49492 Transcript_22593/m.49492 type:complete len:200 (+) Transcript_22593:136-735(+)